MDNKLMLPEETIIEFKRLYKKHYGVELSDQEAAFRATNLINLYQAVYDGEPLPPGDAEEKSGKSTG
ncbi:hypothetical protein MYX78_00995 [Acidobacteria bacterium AH-259-G07]|nr:hypothetical protein [Acidobacteria bacterium AH-259-G07]